ncbi:ABC transporter substrate-binding protein [Cellulosilyticum sp. I15G10I2]|uniref:ABC transporter substrate-binding protein n=1 Tax=Cellulosilyticum sp. I15G10I2 TaxID=1892843 RepID=UPI00085C60AD|nr:ABC transporter substrate-binding protein [Cellulosilyticum sp. I15G10I2]
MKKFSSIILGLTLSMTLFAGCSKPPVEDTAAGAPAAPQASAEAKAETAPKSDIKLTFMSSMVGVPSEALEQACKDFTAETGIQVEYSAPGANYEELMKTKMASQDLPDLWNTHGWSVARYSEYLRPINDQPFAADIVDSIRPLITDKDGQMYVLPSDVDLAGIVYNKDVMDKAGVNVDDIKTWSDFETACEKIKSVGLTPVHIGGKDNWTIGQYFDWVAPSFYITNESKNFRQDFKDGTFDWKNWEEICEMLDKWNQSGYLNVDSLTSDYITGAKALGEGKVGFEFYGNYAITEALGAFPNANLGMMPIPAKDASDEPTLIGGERLATGVWKDTPHMEEALQLLNYLARPDVCAKLATANGMPAGLKGVESDTGLLKAYYEKYADVKTFPYFDREYLPSGMWDDLCITGANILSKQPGTIADAVKQMEQSFNDKFSQK